MCFCFFFFFFFFIFLCFFFFFFKQKTAYEIDMRLEFRRVLFRSLRRPRGLEFAEDRLNRQRTVYPARREHRPADGNRTGPAADNARTGQPASAGIGDGRNDWLDAAASGEINAPKVYAKL